MDSPFDIPDSTDWLETPVPDVSNLESALHCQVCKDFYNTPMITSCSHTFCSLCIRKCLTDDGVCPACRTQDQQVKLRRNWVLEEVVEAFKNARPKLLAFAKRSGEDNLEPPLKKRKIRDSEEESDASSLASKHLPRRSSRRSGQRSTDNASDALDVNDDMEDGLSACPICGKRMKEEAVFPHLDIHTDTSPTTNVNVSTSVKPHSLSANV